MIFWGFNAIILKLLMVTISPSALIFLRIFIATIFLILMYLLRPQSKANKKTKLKYQDLMYGFFGGFFYIYLQLFLHFKGLVLTNATNAILIAGLAPSIAMIFESLLLNKKFALLQKIGVLFAFFGVAISTLGYGDYELNINGTIIIFFGVLIACLGGVFVQKMSQNCDSLTITLIMHSVGLFFFFCEAFITNNVEIGELYSIGLENWTLVLFLSIVNGGIASMVWAWGVSQIGLTKVSIYLPLVPIFGILFAFYILNEDISKLHFFGLICIISSAVMTLGSRSIVFRTP